MNFTDYFIIKDAYLIVIKYIISVKISHERQKYVLVIEDVYLVKITKDLVMKDVSTYC